MVDLITQRSLVQIQPPQPNSEKRLDESLFAFFASFMSRVSGKCYFVYVLWSASGKCFYIGVSEDPVHRLEQHNQSGRGWSARHAPWELVYSERHRDYSMARRREMLLKAQKRGDGFYTITGLDPSSFSLHSAGS